MWSAVLRLTVLGRGAPSPPAQRPRLSTLQLSWPLRTSVSWPVKWERSEASQELTVECSAVQGTCQGGAAGQLRGEGQPGHFCQLPGGWDALFRSPGHSQRLWASSPISPFLKTQSVSCSEPFRGSPVPTGQ